MSGKYISTELLKKQFDPKTLDPLVKEARRKGYSEQDVNEARARAEEIAKIICDGIDLIPAADVEPVVRCRDCEHSEEVDEESKTMFEGDPEFYCGHIDCPVDGNGFCSAGKRKAHMERSGSGE